MTEYEKVVKDVISLCEANGYGFVMDEAMKAWALKEEAKGTGGNFVIGPCEALTVPCECVKGCEWCEGVGWLTKRVKQAKTLAQ